MKNFWQNIFTGVIYFYIMVASIVFVPYYNWKYAKTHGFVKWICFGEVVATAKAAVWPYYVFSYVFSSTPVNRYDSPDDNHFRNSKIALSEAMIILNKVEDVSKFPPDLKAKFEDLLRLAIAEANQVQPLNLKKVHPDYPDMYKKKVIYGMSVILKGVEADDRALVLAGAFELNEFADWIEAHQSEFSH